MLPYPSGAAVFSQATSSAGGRANKERRSQRGRSSGEAAAAQERTTAERQDAANAGPRSGRERPRQAQRLDRAGCEGDERSAGFVRGRTRFATRGKGLPQRALAAGELATNRSKRRNGGGKRTTAQNPSASRKSWERPTAKSRTRGALRRRRAFLQGGSSPCSGDFLFWVTTASYFLFII